MHASGNKRAENGRSTPRRVIATVKLVPRKRTLISRLPISSYSSFQQPIFNLCMSVMGKVQPIKRHSWNGRHYAGKRPDYCLKIQRFYARCSPDTGHSRSTGRPPATTIVGPEYSCSLRKIDMVKAVDGREFNNIAGIRCSYGATVRRVAIQGLVCSPRMEVIQI